jgi:hypothetical protein
MRLPKSVQEIADVIGREAALLLIGALPRSYSGTPGKKSNKVIMYVPTVARLGADHQFVRIIGWHKAVALCKAFGGEIMYPANCADIYRAFRDDSILTMAKQGVKHALLAEWFGVSTRHVWNLTRENPPEERAAAANDNAQVHTHACA